MLIASVIGITMLSISAVLYVMAAVLTMASRWEWAQSMSWYAKRFMVVGFVQVAIIIVGSIGAQITGEVGVQ